MKTGCDVGLQPVFYGVKYEALFLLALKKYLYMFRGFRAGGCL